MDKLKKLSKSNKILLTSILIFTCISLGLVIFQDEELELPTQVEIVGPNAPIADNVEIEEINRSNIQEESSGFEYKVSNAGDNIIQIASAPVTQDEFAKSLSYINSEGDIVEVIESGVTESRFLDDGRLLYFAYVQDTSSVFVYDFLTEENRKVVKTSDPSVINHIAFLTEDEFFFAQPRTGNIGFGIVGSDEFNIIDTKTLGVQSNYVASGAYAYPTISPDLSKIAIIDLSPTQFDFGVTVNIFSSLTESIDNTLINFETTLNPSSSFDSSPISWSRDSKLITAGDSGIVFDTESGQLLHGADQINIESIISPDNNFTIELNLNGIGNVIRDLQNLEQTIDLPDNIFNAYWINDRNITFTIGRKLYMFNLLTEELNLLTEAEGDYEIVNITQDTSPIIFIYNNSNNTLFTVKINS